VLGHLQRGGAPTSFDRVLATRFGGKAVELVKRGEFGTMVAFDPSQIPDIQSVDPTGGDSGTQHQFSAVITGGTPDTYLWNFGGGATPNTSSEESPSVTLGAAGNYNASLKVSNSFGSDSFNFSLDVTVAGGVHINSVSPTTGETGQQVQITADITGTPDTWMWVFNQAASPSVSTNESPTMTLNTPGTYNCSLTATDSVSGQSDTFDFQFTVTPSTQPPDVTDVQPQGGSTGATVQLTPTVGGGPGPYTYAWDFGGGANPNTSTDPAPTVILGATGSYNAKVIVSNVNGSDEYDFPLDVVDLPPPPHVVDVQPTSAEAGSTFTFSTTLSGGTPTSYLWTFPNSLFTVDSSTDPEPTVTCNGMNIANCTLHVENAGGSEDYNFIFSVYFGP